MESVNYYKFEREKHKFYLKHILKNIPSIMVSMDSNRVVLVFFAIGGLDILNELPNLPEKYRESIINWIYRLQVVGSETGGFQGSSTLITPNNENGAYQWGYIACTYSALASLVILGDDLSRVDKEAVLKGLRNLQLPNGCFKGAIEGAEDDMRFVFCAAIICYILNDFSYIDVEKMVQFILNSITYEGGISQGCELEAHSGSTFCAIASLALSKQLHRIPAQKLPLLKRWLLNRIGTGGGFSGRPNKPIDTCYSFWTGGSLKILGCYQFIESELNRQFVLMCQDKGYGGFSKVPNCVPDPLHTYFGLAGLSLMGMDGLNAVVPMLNMTEQIGRAHV